MRATSPTPAGTAALITFFVLFFSLLGFLPAGAAAQSAENTSSGADPSINAYYLDADVQRWKRVFENARREIFRERFRIVQAVRPQPGMRVADVGAGTGFFSLLFARAVGPEGRVYAVDISETFLAEIRRLAVEDYRVQNVETVLNDQSGIGLPQASLDLVFICDTYHHFEQPQRMLASIATALDDGGELILIDFRRIQGASSPWVMGHVRANREEVIEEFRVAGFDLAGEEDFLRENYFLRFRKRPVEVDQRPLP